MSLYVTKLDYFPPSMFLLTKTKSTHLYQCYNIFCEMLCILVL